MAPSIGGPPLDVPNRGASSAAKSATRLKGEGLAARFAALQAVDAVLAHRRPLDEAIERIFAKASLDSRDRAFAFKLATTVLRRLGQINTLIDDCLASPLPARLEPERALIRLGVAQLLFLATPPHAAVDTTVSLARQLGRGGHTPLINAILRRLAVEGWARLAAQDASRLNAPDWLWQAWLAAYGEAHTQAIAAAHLQEPPLDLTVKPEVDAAQLAARLGAVQMPTGSLRLMHASAIADLAGFAAGDWWVQDTAASMPARLLGCVRGKLVFDLCAAPGGKTAQLAAAGARVVAVDRSPARLGRLKENLRRLSLHAETIEADVAVWRPPAAADAVLLDVPCSATGTIRRHPDIAHLKSAEEVGALVKVQTRLLTAAIQMLKPGGLLVYCACSLQPEEGVGVVDSLIAAGLPIQRVPILANELGNWGDLLTTAGDLRTLPCHLGDAGGIDGFYAARLRRH